MSQIYSLLNDVKTNIDLYEKEELTDIEMAKMKKFVKLKRGKSRSLRTLASMACALLVVILVENTAFADEIHDVTKSIGWQISNFLGIEKDLQDYVTVLNTSQTDKGYTITLNEVILDKSELVVSSLIKSEKPIADGLTAYAEVYVNGKNVLNASSGGSKQLDDYAVESVINYKLKNVNTDEKLDYIIEFNQIGEGGNTIKGNWDFSFRADGEALAADTIHIPLNAYFKLPNGVKLQLTEYTSNSLGDRIYFDLSNVTKHNGAEYDMNLEGKDDLGNDITFYLSYMDGDGHGCFKASEPLDKASKSIMLKPYAVKFPEKNGKLNNDFISIGDEFTLDMGNLKK